MYFRRTKNFTRYFVILVLLVNFQFYFYCSYKLRNPLYERSLEAITNIENIKEAHRQIDRLKKQNVDAIKKQAHSIYKNTKINKGIYDFFSITNVVVSALILKDLLKDSYNEAGGIYLAISTPITPRIKPPLTKKQAFSFHEEIINLTNELHMEWTILYDQDEKNLNIKKALLKNFDKKCRDIKEEYGILYKE